MLTETFIASVKWVKVTGGGERPTTLWDGRKHEGFVGAEKLAEFHAKAKAAAQEAAAKAKAAKTPKSKPNGAIAG